MPGYGIDASNIAVSPIGRLPAVQGLTKGSGLSAAPFRPLYQPPACRPAIRAKRGMEWADVGMLAVRGGSQPRDNAAEPVPTGQTSRVRDISVTGHPAGICRINDGIAGAI